jgi:hypothetical protein
VSISRFSRSNRLILKHSPVWLYDESGGVAVEVRESLGGYAGQAADGKEFGTDSILTNGITYYLDVDDATKNISRSGTLIRTSGTWPAEPRCERVTYYGGWKRADLDGGEASAIKQAAIVTVAANFWKWQAKTETSGKGTALSETIGKHSESFDGRMVAGSLGLNVDVPDEALLLLMPFVSFGRLVA